MRCLAPSPRLAKFACGADAQLDHPGLMLQMSREDWLKSRTGSCLMHSAGVFFARRASGTPFACNRLHFRRIMFDWTDPSLGNCSYLDTCRHMNKCKFIHYELDDSGATGAAVAANGKGAKPAVPAYLQVLLLPVRYTLRLITRAAMMLRSVFKTAPADVDHPGLAFLGDTQPPFMSIDPGMLPSIS